MLSQYKNKTGKPVRSVPESSLVVVEDLETGVVTRAMPDALVVHNNPAQKMELIGLRAALKSEDSNFPRVLNVNAATVAICGNAATSMATTITALILEGPETETQYTLAAEGVSTAVSYAAQIYSAYQYHKGIQELQCRFIGEIVDLISKCYVNNDEKKIDLALPFSAKGIIDFMYKHGQVTIELKVPGVIFTLKDNSFNTVNVARPLVGGLGAGALSIGLSLGYRLAGEMFEKQSMGDIAMRITGSTLSSMPYIHLSTAITKWRDKQERNILHAIELVMRSVYLDQGELHNMPVPFLSLLAYFIDERDMVKNYELLVQSIKVSAPDRSKLDSKPAVSSKAQLKG